MEDQPVDGLRARLAPQISITVDSDTTSSIEVLREEQPWRRGLKSENVTCEGECFHS
jgi:hypothetical protein